MGLKSSRNTRPGTPRWDKWLESHGLLRYQTEGLSRADVQERYNRYGLEPHWPSLGRLPGESAGSVQPTSEAWGPKVNVPQPRAPTAAAPPTIGTPNMPAVVTPVPGVLRGGISVQGSGHGISIPGLTVMPMDLLSTLAKAGHPWWDEHGVMHRGDWNLFGLSLQDRSRNVYRNVVRTADGYRGYDLFGHEVHIDPTGRITVLTPLGTWAR